MTEDVLPARRFEIIRAALDAQRERTVGMLPFVAITVLLGVCCLVGAIVILTILGRIAHRSVIRDGQLCEQANIDIAFRPLFIPVPVVTEEIDAFVADVRAHDLTCQLITLGAATVLPAPTATVTVTKTKHGRRIVTVLPPVIVTVTPHPKPSKAAAAPHPTRHRKPSPAPSKTCLYTIPVTGQPVCLHRM